MKAFNRLSSMLYVLSGMCLGLTCAAIGAQAAWDKYCEEMLIGDDQQVR